MLLSTIIEFKLNIFLRGCLFQLISAFHENKPGNPTKQLGCIGGFPKAKASNTLHGRDVLPVALPLNTEPVHCFATVISHIYKNLPLSCFPTISLEV
jgi:hypothetical protein